MKYRKIETQTYNLHVIKTKKFKTVTVQVNFKSKVDKEEITYRNLLINTLCLACKKYPTKRMMEIATEDLYELTYQATNYISGKYNVMCFDITFLNDEYTEDGNFEASLDFLCELLFNPLTETTHTATKFKKSTFDLACKTLEDNIKTVKENPALYSRMRLFEIMSPNSIHSYRSCGTLEDLNKITSTKLYEYYLNMLKKDILDIFVIGNVSEPMVRKAISDRIKIRTIKKRSESHFISMKRTRLLPKTVVEKQDISQSQLALGFKLDRTSDFEKRYVLNVFSYILGGGPDSMLFKDVREKHSMCYSISSSGVPLQNAMIITAGISACNFKRAVSLIKKNLKSMQQGNFSNDDIMKAKITYMNSIKELEDNPQNLLSLYTGMEYLKSDNIDNRIKKISKVRKKDVMKLASKIHLDVIYFLQGGEDNEN